MDKDTRNAIERATQKARRLLEEDFAEQLDGKFDVRADRDITSRGGAHLSGREHLLRDKIVAAIEHKRSAGMKPAEAVADYIRDAAFTALNRFAALKMLEARELVQECVSRGDASSGFAEFCGLAPALKTADGLGYRLYIESIFDELSTEVKVLFDRRDPASVLWPTKLAFDALLAMLNHADLAGVWSEDETIGWIYQFFNSGEERRKMRDESQAPRNSRELAIRNQFFTPSYVVQFLCDNTLGRIWYEMRAGDTRLAVVCEHLVRGADGNADEAGVEGRAKKDPRDLRIIDPACGSGHFLLYCFLLLLIIYEEAWADDASPQSGATGRSLRTDYPALEELRKAAPALILSHNLHGVDIDPRCAQIAQLALWMRGQRAFKDAGMARSERPIIRRANIVIAEPMPGDASLMEEFGATLQPAILGSLFKQITSEMRFAGEMGALLPIERKLAASIQEARLAFVEQTMRAGDFLPGLAPAQSQSEVDLSGIDDFSFFEQAEAQILGALQRYVKEAADGRGTRRRLFAEDAEQGIAFVELMRGQFDVVLMNPPFGDPSVKSTDDSQAYIGMKHDISTAFVDRAQGIAPNGLVGVLMTRTPFFLTYLTKWREQFINRTGSLLFLDLGQGVLDALVETCAVCLSAENEASRFISVRGASDKGAALRGHFLQGGTVRESQLSAFSKIPKSPFIYWIEDPIRDLFKSGDPIKNDRRNGYIGAITQDDYRFTRLWWEVSFLSQNEFRPIAKAGTYQPYVGHLPMRVNWRDDAKELKAFLSSYRAKKGFSEHWTAQLNGYDHYFKKGITWSSRPHRIGSFWALPEGSVFGNSGPAIIDESEDELCVALAILNSPTYLSLLNLLMPRGSDGDGQTLKYELGYVTTVPFPSLVGDEKDRLARLVRSIFELFQNASKSNELSVEFDGATSNYPSWEKEFEAEKSAVAIAQSGYLKAKGSIEVLVRNAYARTGIMGLQPLLDLERETSAQRDLSQHILLQDPVASAFAIRLLSKAIGKAFGRFPEISVSNKRASPFEAFARLSHGASQSFFVDDDGHQSDIVRRIEDVIPSEKLASMVAATGWQGSARAWLAEKFFISHLSMFSAGRRSAPIYWQLAVPSKRFSVWLYFHSFTKDSMFRIQTDCVVPKLEHEIRTLNELRDAAEKDPAAGRRKKIEEQEAFVGELQSFAEELRRVAPILSPVLDDGVAINFSPLWRLAPQHKPWQKELKATWDALCTGSYEWSGLAMHLWPERVLPKCATDRSLAIAHGLEDNFWFEGDDGKWRSLETPKQTINMLIAERTSAAVKAALKNLLDAPEKSDGVRRSRRSKAA